MVVQPSDLLPPGPAPPDGHTASVFPAPFSRGLARASIRPPPPAEVSAGSFNDSLVDYDGELPAQAAQTEVGAMLAPFAPRTMSELRLRTGLARRLPRRAGAARRCPPLQPHPDRYRAARLARLETACRGPREYDLAALVLDDRSRVEIRRLGRRSPRTAPTTRDILEQALPVYASSWLAASFMAAVARRLGRRAGTRAPVVVSAPLPRLAPGVVQRVIRSRTAGPHDRGSRSGARGRVRGGSPTD